MLVSYDSKIIIVHRILELIRSWLLFLKNQFPRTLAFSSYVKSRHTLALKYLALSARYLCSNLLSEPIKKKILFIEPGFKPMPLVAVISYIVPLSLWVRSINN